MERWCWQGKVRRRRLPTLSSAWHQKPHSTDISTVWHNVYKERSVTAAIPCWISVHARAVSSGRWRKPSQWCHAMSGRKRQQRRWIGAISRARRQQDIRIRLQHCKKMNINVLRRIWVWMCWEDDFAEYWYLMLGFKNDAIFLLHNSKT